MGIKSNCKDVSNVDVNTQEHNSKHVNGNQVNNVTECEHSSVKANVFIACKGMVAPDNMTDNVLRYPVNIRLILILNCQMQCY